MESIELGIYKQLVYDEVAKATDYTGSKIVGDDALMARDRILASEDDLVEMDGWWEECISGVGEYFREWIRGILADDKKVVCTLEVSRAFDRSLTGCVQRDVMSYFVKTLIGHWFVYSNKGEAAGYFAEGLEALRSAERKLCSRKRPVKPSV